MSKGKGSQFERDICRQLSLWWTDGKRDDVFWRTSGSGARATVRSKNNKATYGQHGDIQAVDPVGKPLMDICTIEIKRGYSGASFADLIDKPKDSKPSTYEKFLWQTQQESEQDKKPFWFLIVKRDRRDSIIFIPLELVKLLKDFGLFKNRSYSFGFIKPAVLDKLPILYVTKLDDFLFYVSPKMIKRISKDYDYGQNQKVH